MFKYAFVSRHAPTPEQVALAAKAKIELVPVGDLDAFTVDAKTVRELCPGALGAVVVHPAAAVRLLFSGLPVGVFENANRAPVGQPPQFEAKALHLFSADCDPYTVQSVE